MKPVRKFGLILLLTWNGLLFFSGALMVEVLIHFYGLTDFDSSPLLHSCILVVTALFLFMIFAVPLTKKFPVEFFICTDGRPIGWLLRQLGSLCIWGLHFLVELLGVFCMTDWLQCAFMTHERTAMFVALSLAWMLGNVWQFRALRKEPLVLWRRPRKSNVKA